MPVVTGATGPVVSLPAAEDHISVSSSKKRIEDSLGEVAPKLVVLFCPPKLLNALAVPVLVLEPKIPPPVAPAAGVEPKVVPPLPKPEVVVAPPNAPKPVAGLGAPNAEALAAGC